ncbi:MAG: chemotaxis protein CheW [Geobacteraceae bacterium GWC2_58_44]|nr:MAG: chemotaxis protein CheW [Geobacteraceae bacterium GWC2_58_44]
MTEERFLLFSAAGEGFACNLQEISEVMEPQASFPIPRAPRHFTGLINFHGTLTALVDLGLYLGRAPEGGPGKLLVLDARVAGLALRVDGVSSIITRDSITDESPGEDPLTAAHLTTEQGKFRLLRLEALLCDLEQGL